MIVAMQLKARRREMAHRERMALAEKGLEIPEVLYEIERGKPLWTVGGLRIKLIIIGILLALAGVGAMVAAGVNDGPTAALSASAPLLLGIALIVAERVIAVMFDRNGGRLCPRFGSPTSPAG